MPEIFAPALQKMAETGSAIYGPEPFQEYLANNSGSAAKTAASISVQTVTDLKSELKAAETMVLRLGQAPESTHTQFALVRTFHGWSDYFFVDKEIFSDCTPEAFVPETPVVELFPFFLLPSFVEMSLVNLAVASGLFGHALGLDSNNLASAPATGQSTYSFRFRPHRELEDQFEHRNGQVEIDALIVGKRNDKPVVFVVEAKSSKDFDSLAKHKLLYAVLAMRSKLPPYMPVVPVYLRVIETQRDLKFYVAECGQVDSKNPILNELEATTQRQIVLTKLEMPDRV